MIPQYFFDLSGLTVTPSNPNYLGWKSAKKTKVAEIRILCDNKEIMLSGKRP